MVGVIPAGLGVVVGIDFIIFRRSALAVLGIGRDGQRAERAGVFPRHVEVADLDAEVQFNAVAFAPGGSGGLRVKHTGEVGHQNGVAVAGNFRRVPVVQVRRVQTDNLQGIKRIGGIGHFVEAGGMGVRAL